MKQKYVVLLDNETGKLAIQEYAELDKEMLSLLCEETYDAEAIKAAMEKDRNALIQALRTHNMYPPGTYTERIADAIVEMFQPGANSSAELFFEERDLFEPVVEDGRRTRLMTMRMMRTPGWRWMTCSMMTSMTISKKKGSSKI